MNNSLDRELENVLAECKQNITRAIREYEKDIDKALIDLCCRCSEEVSAAH